MRHLLKFTLAFSALGIGMTLAGCGFIRGDYEKPEPEKYYYNTGEPVDAVGYAESQTIQLFQLTKEGEPGNIDAFQEIRNGAYIDKGIHTLGIRVTPEEGQVVQTVDQRVFVGDGGWDYQIEAFLNNTSGLYICDFEFQDADIYLTHPVLVQVISPDGKASKEKIVVTTYQGLRPEPGMLVENGMGISVSAALLDSMKGLMAGMLGEDTPVPVDIYGFGPAPYEAGSEGIFHLDTNIMSCDIALKDTYTNADGEEVRGLSTKLVNITGITSDPENIMERLMNFVFNYFGDFLLNTMGLSERAVGPVAVSLTDLLAGLGGTDQPREDTADVDPMAALMQDMEMDTILFLNLYGIPTETNEDFAVIGGGIYSMASILVETDDEDMPVWPDIAMDTTNTGMNLDRIKDTQKDIDLGIALSQYNVNHMLGEIMGGMQMKVKDVQELGLPIFSPVNPGDGLDMLITINPGGAAMNLIPLSDPDSPESGIFAINDMRLELVEEGTSVAELSMDLNMALNINLVAQDGEYMLQLVLSPDYDHCYFHVLKDDLGVSAIDHSRMVEVLFRTLIGSEGRGMILPIPLGMTKKAGSALNPVEFDPNGNCFMNLAVENLDTSSIPGCFIDTANFCLTNR